MKTYLTRPLFITLEGGEGAGKGIQKIALLKFIQDNDNKILGTKYTDIVLSREPTNYSHFGKEFNFKLANKIPMSANEQTRLVIDDRFEHVKDIQEEIAKGKFYVCDRFFDSTGAYQVLQGMDWKKVFDLHRFGKPDGMIIPDLTIYISIDGKTSLERTKNREVKDAFDEDSYMITNLDDAYRVWFEKTKELLPDRHIVFVNGGQSIDKVTAEMYSKITEVIKNNYDFFRAINN